MLVNAFPKQARAVDYVIEGQVTNSLGQGVGTWGTFVEVSAYMKQHNLHTALLVGQAHHIGRPGKQAEKLGIDFVIPPHLPAQFDADSGQSFTRSLVRWLPREIFGSLILRLQKKLYEIGVNVVNSNYNVFSYLLIDCTQVVHIVIFYINQYIYHMWV